VRQAETYLALSDDALWGLIPGTKLPRHLYVCRPKGEGNFCPKCGPGINKFGNYPFTPQHLTARWKLTCPSCKETFPKNDFGKYYASCIDETGAYNPEKGDRSLLFNTEHPDPNDPLHLYGVDDGTGFQDKDGKRYFFIGFYSHWMQYSLPPTALEALGQAFVLTGDQKYADKALILLDRFADLYPGYQGGYVNAAGKNVGGKSTDYIWETNVINRWSRGVDMVTSGIRGATRACEFLAQKARQYKLPRPKGTPELLLQNLDDGIMREGARAIRERVVLGNEGSHQSAMAAAALALNTNPETEQWLDWLFKSGPETFTTPEGATIVDGGHLPGLILGSLDRDGVGAECSPSYSLGWGAGFARIADWLAEYPSYTKHSIYRDLPPFRAAITAPTNLLILGYTTPNIGDSGECGSLGKVGVDANALARGYGYTQDPKIGLAAYYACEGRTEALGRDLYAADPDALGREIAALGKAAEKQGNPFAGGRNRTGYRMASVEFGWGKPGTALWMYYGNTLGGNHGHRDRFNFDLMYRGLCLLPDHGYPEDTGTWPQRLHATRNTIFHNTVVVNQLQQTPEANGGFPSLFCQLEDFGAVRVDSPQVYAGVDKYQRTMAFVKIGEGQAYAFDVFRVKGGKDHVFSLHGPPGPVTTTALNLAKQEQGTYAGPDVPYRDQTLDASKPLFGYPWLCNIERDPRPPAGFVVDWKAETGYRGVTAQDDIHLRYHCLSQFDDVAFGDGEPPQNKQGNPKWLRYLLGHRAGEKLGEVYTGILEPYSGEPVIARVERLATTVTGPVTADPLPVCLKVTLRDGAVDYLVASDDDQALIKTAGGPEFAGAVGWLRVRDGKVQTAALSRGTRLALGQFVLELPAPGLSGRIVKMKEDLAGKGYVWVEGPLTAGEALVGQQMIIANDGLRNACYTIESVATEGALWKVSLGDVCFVRDFKDSGNYAAGYTYNFAAGAAFIIPHNVRVATRVDGAYTVRATGEVTLSVPR
jgi:hypothetical protein